MCEGLVIGALVPGDRWGTGLATWDGIVIGPATGIGTDGVVTFGVLARAGGAATMLVAFGEPAMLVALARVVTGEIATLGVASAYGSIGSISPDGPAYGEASTSITVGPYGSTGCMLPSGAIDERAGRTAERGAGNAASAAELR